MANVRVRFAPSPTGHLHIGSARTALFNWLVARRLGGDFILRIEDTDLGRSTLVHERAIISDLKWLGLGWNEGPDMGGKYGPYRQSERLGLYKQAANNLLEKGLAYKCYCSQDELEAERQAAQEKGEMPKYSGRCLRITARKEDRLAAEGRKPTIRFRVPKKKVVVKDMVKGDVEFDSEVFGDFILVRSDGTASFNFAVVYDDAAMKISHVIRGEDHLTNTARHLLLFEALGHQPPFFAHMPITLGADHTKLSKRHGATSINEYAEQGYLASALINYLVLLGWSSPDAREIFTPEELIQLFSIGRISKSAAVFDIDKLNWINGQHIRALSADSFTRIVAERLTKAGYIKEINSIENKISLPKIAEAIQTSVVKLADVVESARMFYEDAPRPSEKAIEELKGDGAKMVICALYSKMSALEARKDIDFELAKELLKATAGELKEKGLKGKEVYHPIRLALTGLDSGPELFYLISIFGREKCLQRLKGALQYV
ncbi:MAG: glutamate--tRNA ligase [Actinomycetota bacterium]|nr:glutamate--tRNA ligase [Actinomycetota bacterium]